ncbi:MAG: TonB C-terminal domain-containing protein [Proteobacteria bacterium]|nr:TonB C-terminal domain-containing protein [Pseudomonadota bacterium]
MSAEYRDTRHKPTAAERFFSILVTILVHGGILVLVALSSGSEPIEQVKTEGEKIFCRYIDNGRLFQVEIEAADWQEAEEQVCGSHRRDVRLSPLLLEGALLILEDTPNAVVLAQRESCSCSKEERVPILQDISIVEAPRLGAETRKTALPRIINTPEPAAANVVTTKNNPEQKKTEKPRKQTPTLDDLLNAATEFDEARPISDVDPGGSADGSRLSKSATGKGDPYLQKIKARLDNAMNAPASIPKSELQKLSAKLWIKVGDNGTVWSWDFYSKSGNAAFDRMIESTIKQFMMGGNLKFATPPEQWRLQTIPFTVEGKDIK